jgi:hypothetical protein
MSVGGTTILSTRGDSEPKQVVDKLTSRQRPRQCKLGALGREATDPLLTLLADGGIASQ